VPSLTPAQEAALRAHQIDVQMKDAAIRNVVWSVEGDEDPDAEGEPDDGYVLTADGTYEKQTAAGDSLPAPIGIRNQDGLVVPIPFEDGDGDGQARYAREDGPDVVMDVHPVTQSEVVFEGVSEPVRTRVGDLVCLHSVSKGRELILYRFKIWQMQRMSYSIKLSKYVLHKTLRIAPSRKFPVDMVLLCPSPSLMHSLASTSRLALIIQQPSFVTTLTLIHRYSET